MNEFICGKYCLPFGQKKYLMGILNVTPDSFSDGGKYNNVRAALMHTEKMLSEGADIIDVGGMSTRPFSVKVSEEEEWRRLRYIIPEIIRNFDVPVSVDTFSPSVAERCLDAGADIINDVSGVFLSDMADVIKKYNCGWIIMHGGVNLRKTEAEAEFPDGIVNDVNAFFGSMLEKIKGEGIASERICLDAGFGFSKNSSQNIELLKNYEKINKNGLPLLCALSRKRFIGEMYGEADAEKRDNGTLEANKLALAKGADILRVHNVAIHRELTRPEIKR